LFPIFFYGRAQYCYIYIGTEIYNIELQKLTTKTDQDCTWGGHEII